MIFDHPLLEQFENSLPRLLCESESIVLEPSETQGRLILRNSGGGLLSGFITSNTPAITFSPESFEGNRVEIDYSLSLDVFARGDVVCSSALILSNGGELTIPITIKIAEGLETPGGQNLFDLRDYVIYFKQKPDEAKTLFGQDSFKHWLNGQKYEQMELYNFLSAASNRALAVDNFFIMNKLKRKSMLMAPPEHMDVMMMPGQTEVISGEIIFHRTGWGYLKRHLKWDAHWLNLTDNTITDSAFDENNEMRINYFIDPKKVRNLYNSVRVDILGEEGYHFNINAVYMDLLKISVSQDSLDYEDQGELFITNNAGRDLLVEITPKDSFIRFESRKYYVSSLSRIPFLVRVSKLQQAQGFLTSKGPISSSITVKASFVDRSFVRTVPISIGTL